MKANVYNQKGEQTRTIELPEDVFGVGWNGDLVHQVITSMRSNLRKNTAHTKDRGDVRGGGKKPWPQKGTGRARHGSKRSPIWVGGGVAHGPRNERNYFKKINRKMKAKALYSVLSHKFANGRLVFVDAVSMDAPKTREASTFLHSLEGNAGFEGLGTRRRNAALLAFAEQNEFVSKSFGNIPSIGIAEARNLNALDLLQYRYLVVVDPDQALETLKGKL